LNIQKRPESPVDMMKRKIVSRTLTILFFLFMLAYFFQSELYRLHPDKAITESQENILWKEAAQSLSTSDVPIGALIIYDDTILSTGHNTVLPDSNVAAHAEINAINNAIRKIGSVSFSKLDRKKLILVSTFEPCQMCQGAINENHILHTSFMKGKGIYHWLKNDAQQFRYEWNRRQSEGDEKQDSLFMLHPKFRKQNQK